MKKLKEEKIFSIHSRVKQIRAHVFKSLHIVFLIEHCTTQIYHTLTSDKFALNHQEPQCDALQLTENHL